MTGGIGILNVGAGDTKLSFDKKNPAECIRAGRIVKDMLRRGYALLVQTGTDKKSGDPIYSRATDFDENTSEYIIADFDPVTAAAADKAEAAAEAVTEGTYVGTEAGSASPEGGGAKAPRAARKGTALKERRIPAGSTRGVAVSRSAGG